MKRKDHPLKEIRCAEILDKALGVFSQKGFAGTSMDDIAREAGLVKGTIYLYFRSKEELHSAVLLADLETLTNCTLERIDQAHGLRDKIEAYVRTRFELCEARRDFFRILQTEACNLAGPPLLTKELIDKFYEVARDRLTSVIREECKPGEVGALYPEACAWAVVDVTRGALERRLTHPGESLDIGVIVEFLCAAMRCTNAPAAAEESIEQNHVE